MCGGGGHLPQVSALVFALDHLLTSVAGMVADNSTTNPSADFPRVTTLRYVVSANPRVWVEVRLYRSEQGPIAHMLCKVGFCFYAPTLQRALRQRLHAALTSTASHGAAALLLSSSTLDWCSIHRVNLHDGELQWGTDFVYGGDESTCLLICEQLRDVHRALFKGDLHLPDTELSTAQSWAPVPDDLVVTLGLEGSTNATLATAHSGSDGAGAAKQAAALTALEQRFDDNSADYLTDDQNQLSLEQTETWRMARQRQGQSIYRQRLECLWQGRCAVTGISQPELLRASHAKPWAECTTGAERLSSYNGFLLSVPFDALFDQFLLSFADDGTVLLSPQLELEELRLVGISTDAKLRFVRPQHLTFLAYHRQRFYERQRS